MLGGTTINKMSSVFNDDNDDFHTFIEWFMSAYGATKDTIAMCPYFDVVKDSLDVINEVGSDVSTIANIIKKFGEIMSIPDKLFMKRVGRYLNGISQIPLDKRQKYIKKTAKVIQEEDAVFTLSILEKSEELSKIDIFVKLFAAKVNGELDETGYRRMMRQTDRTLYSDIIFMKDNICHGELTLSTDELQSLSADGWLKYAGMTILDIEKGETDSNAYEYTTVAKQFCKIVFNTDIDARPHADSNHVEMEAAGEPQSDPLTE